MTLQNNKNTSMKSQLQVMWCWLDQSKQYWAGRQSWGCI